ncbi:hypothetical protein ACMGD3_07445 [Lysinibacillus sphaericus]|uniref:hypothetical protein n=1 Tax=Lysinibacillus sphaericus TaxID=1421 RepID=UPI003F7A23FC
MALRVLSKYSSKDIKRVTAVPGSEWFRQTDGTSKQVQTSTSYSKGALIQSIQAEDGTYPVDGRHTDGYWYTRG